jgi:hypothetical protein
MQDASTTTTTTTTTMSLQKCPVEYAHRPDSKCGYLMRKTGIGCCSFCRKIMTANVDQFVRDNGFHPMYDPDAFLQCKLFAYSPFVCV